MTDTLSVDAAVNLLGSPASDAVIEGEFEVVADAAPAAEAAEPGEEQEIPDGDQPSDPDAAETPSEGADEAVEPAKPAIDPPHFWSADAKARFGELPYELQLVVSENEKAGSKATTQKLEEAANARKAAEARAEALAGLTERIEAAATQAETTFADRWAGMTPEVWLKLSRDDPGQYIALKAQHEAEQDAVQRSRTAKDAAERVRRQNWHAEQIEALKTLAPELIDPVKGPQNLKELEAYLTTSGVSEQDLPNVGALEMAIARKAMLYDRGVAGLKSRPTPSSPVVKPTAPASKTLSQSAAETAARRLGQTGDVDDAVALMQARRKN